MQAAVLPVTVSKTSAGAAHGMPLLDPTKPDDTMTGADGFAQALAGLMGVTAAPAPAVQPTTSDPAPQSATKADSPKPTAIFAASLPAPALATTSADTTQTPAATPSAPPAADADALAALMQTAGDEPSIAPPPAAATAAAPAPKPPATTAQTGPAPKSGGAANAPMAFSALSFSVTLSGTSAPPATQPDPTALAQSQAPTTATDIALAAMPIASMTLTAEEAAAAIPASASAPVKPVAAASTKALAKPDAASAGANAGPEAADDPPVAASAAPASPSVDADAADRNSKPGSGASDQTHEAPSGATGGGTTDLSALATAPVAQQAAPQPSTGLAAANGAAIVSQIATQVAKSVDGKSTRFDISLDPAGLGHVNVKVEIGAQGQVTAQLSFDNAHTAAEAKSQAGQLQQALEQAGFNIAQGGLSFDVSGQGAGFAGQQASAQQPLATVETADLSPTSQTAAIATASSRPASGVDITI